MLTRLKNWLYGRTVTVFTKTDDGEFFLTVEGVRKIDYETRELAFPKKERRTVLNLKGWFGRKKGVFWMQDVIAITLPKN